MSESTSKEITRPAEVKKGPGKTILWILFLIILGTLVGFSIANTKTTTEASGTEVAEVVETEETTLSEAEQQNFMLIMLVLGGGLIIIIAVVVTVVSSTVSSVASAVDDEEE